MKMFPNLNYWSTCFFLSSTCSKQGSVFRCQIRPLPTCRML